MFISTVRTQHLIEASHVQSGALTEADGEKGDFGFLSDPKLLNTALTRAQSQVVVVGDPVVLCAIGECVNVWRTYLKHCQNMKSLYPQNHNFESIRQQVQNLLNSPARERLLEIANQKQAERGNPSLSPASASSSSGQPLHGYSNIAQGVTSAAPPAVVEKTKGVTLTPQTSRPEPVPQHMGLRKTPLGGALGLALKRPSPLAPLNGKPAQKQAVEAYEVGDEYTLDPDDVILQLARQVSAQVSSLSVHIREERGHAVVYCNGQPSKTNVEVAPENLPIQKLESLLLNAKKYIRCILHIDGKTQYADSVSGQKVRVVIQNRWLCGQAHSGDEVVVEVLLCDSSSLYGKVVGVLKAARDLASSYIVCTASEHCAGMVPIDPGLSQMYNLVTAVQMEAGGGKSVTVYRVTKTRQVIVGSQEELHPGELTRKLFVARFLKWETNISLPLCIVVGVIDVNNSITSGLSIINLESGVKRTPGVESADETYPASFDVMSLVTAQHTDLRAGWCFTIDLPGLDGVGRAFSIDENEDGSYQVGVHISDVASLVKKNSRADTQALNNGFSLVPLAGHPVNMLPQQLCAELCNLKLNQDRLAVSVLLTVQSSGEVTNVLYCKSIINCKKHYTYGEAEEVLHDPNAHEDYLKSCILVLFEISRIWRKERLGNAAVYQEKLLGNIGTYTQQLVHELVIRTEQHVAEKLTSSFPLTTPLCIQGPPVDSELTVWKKEHAADAINSVALNKPFLNTEQLETCGCCLACTHTVNYVVQYNIPKREHVEVLAQLWDALNDALANHDHNYMQNIIVSAQNHPQLAVAQAKLEEIQSSQMFACSSFVSKKDQYHYTVNQRPYTSVTSALSCYIDLVVQRILLAALDSVPCPYTAEELQAICSKVNLSLERKRKYENDVLRLHVGHALLSHPVMIQPIIQTLTAECLTLCFPTLPVVPDYERQVALLQLAVCDSPVVLPDGQVQLKWQARVYDVNTAQAQKPATSNSTELNPDRFIYKISPFQWQRLLIAVREPDEMERVKKLTAAVQTVRKQVTNPALNGNYLEEVSSEGLILGQGKNVTEFTMNMHVAQVLRVQMSSDIVNGTLTPFVQLVNLTPRLDICLHHRRSPQECFVGSVNEAFSTESISISPDLDTYQKLWSPINQLESASRAVSRPDNITIQGVSLLWPTSASGLQMATFRLSIQFMLDRRIKFQSHCQLKELFHPANKHLRQAHFADFVCIRHSGVSLPIDSSLPAEVAALVGSAEPVTWMGHGVISEVSIDNDYLNFQIQLTQSNLPLPRVFKQRQEQFTLEIITRNEEDE